jgi:stringent starvation protein B
VFASSSVTPYLIRAYHEWMEDSGLTPHILVDCSKADVVVPKPFIQAYLNQYQTFLSATIIRLNMYQQSSYHHF